MREVLKQHKQQIASGAIVATLIAILCLSVFTLGRGYQLLLDEHLGVNEPQQQAISGRIIVRVNHGDGWQLWWDEHNVITTVGRNQTCHYLFDQSAQSGQTAFYYIAIGTGSGGGVGSTGLVTEFTRATATFAAVPGVTYNCTLTKTWAAGTFSGETISEAGVLNDPSAGTLFNYQDFTGITLQSGDSLQVTFEFQIGS